MHIEYYITCLILSIVLIKLHVGNESFERLHECFQGIKLVTQLARKAHPTHGCCITENHPET
jgi:hypothetical protein